MPNSQHSPLIEKMLSQKIKIEEEVHFRVMSLLEANPNLTQRELAENLGISLGAINYCLKALVNKGFVKMMNFQKSKHKFKYAYLLTPSGVAEKMALTSLFLRCKMEEYESLKNEIELLRNELEKKEAGTQSPA